MCVTRPVGTRGRCGAGWGPCACPGGNAIQVGAGWSKQVKPQRGQAPGRLIHSTASFVPTGDGRAFSIIPRFGRQNSLGRTNKKEQVSTMTEYDPKQVIIDYLSLPEGEIISQPDPDTPAVLKDGRLVRPGILRRGGGMGARPASVRFLKERSIPHRQVPAVTFEEELGQQWDYVCFVAQDAKGRWHFESGGGGGTSGAVTGSPMRSGPWANLADVGSETRFCAAAHLLATRP